PVQRDDRGPALRLAYRAGGGRLGSGRAAYHRQGSHERDPGRAGRGRGGPDARREAAEDDRIPEPGGGTCRYAWRWTVLGGEVAVPCHPQSALAGLNPGPRGWALGVSTPAEGGDGQVPCAGRP